MARSSAASISNLVGASSLAMVWKSEAGRVGSANFERPEEIDRRLSDRSSRISEPSGSLRTTSNSVCAGAVTERPDLFVAMAAYGDYGPWYIGTAQAYEEGGYETQPRSSNVGPGAEAVLMGAIKKLLKQGGTTNEH